MATHNRPLWKINYISMVYWFGPTFLALFRLVNHRANWMKHSVTIFMIKNIYSDITSTRENIYFHWIGETNLPLNRYLTNVSIKAFARLYYLLLYIFFRDFMTIQNINISEEYYRFSVKNIRHSFHRYSLILLYINEVRLTTGQQKNFLFQKLKSNGRTK